VNRHTLCTPRSDDVTDQISVRSDSWLGHQRAINTISATTPERLDQLQIVIMGTSNKLLSWVHLIRIHDIIPGFLI
jgi:hypothetical protein